MADKKISQLTPTTTVDLADKYALARGAGNFYVSYQTLQNNLATNTGSFVKTVNAVAPDAVGNVAVSLVSVETGLSSSFPALPSDGDVYVISGETATDRTGSNGQSFIYSSASVDWFRLSGLDEAGNDARYVNTSGDTMTGALTLPSDPTVALHAATKQYVDNSTAVGTNAQTLRFNGTTLEASSLLTNDGSQISIGNASPKVQDILTITDGADTRVRIGRSDLTPERDYLEIRSSTATGSLVANNEWLIISASSTGGGANIRLDAAGGATYNSNRQIKAVADPTAAQDAATKQYTDLFYDSSSFNSSGNVLQLHKGNSTIDSITIVSSSYAVTASHAITASSVLHLEQDVFISGTLFQSGSVEMNNFYINNQATPTASLQSANKFYVDSIKLDNIYDVFDLTTNLTYVDTEGVGNKCVLSVPITSGSQHFVVSMPNGTGVTTLIIKEFDTTTETLGTNVDTIATNQFLRNVAPFHSGSKSFFFAGHYFGESRIIKFENDVLSEVQSFTGAGNGEQGSNRNFIQDPTDENKGVLVYSQQGTPNYVMYRMVGGTFETTNTSIAVGTANRSQQNTTHVIYFEGDYYFSTFNNTSKEHGIYKFDYNAETVEEVLTYPAQTGGVRVASALFEANGKVFSAVGTTANVLEFYEADLIKKTYNYIGASSYVAPGVGIHFFGENDKENSAKVYLATNGPVGSDERMRPILFDTVKYTITDLPERTTGTDPGPPHFIEANSVLYPVVPCYNSNRIDVFKLDSNFKVGETLIASDGNWKKTSETHSSILLPSGTTTQRDLNSISGSIRFNTDTNNIEVLDTSSWQNVATKNYVDNKTATITKAGVFSTADTATAIAAGQKLTFNYWSDRQSFTSDASAVSWSNTNNEFSIGEGTWEFTFSFRNDSSTVVNFIRMWINTTAGASAASGTRINEAPVNNADEYTYFRTFYTVAPGTTRYLHFNNSAILNGRFMQASIEKITN